MTLEEFIIESHKDVERFREMWTDGMHDTPDQFPFEMNPGDWFDQFIGFVTSDDSDD